MDDKLLLRLERCGRCLHLFAICRCCYRGQTYCGDDCRVPARAAQKSAARATYQGSPEGREDHRDRNRELRKCAAPRVMDQGSEILAPSSSVWLPKGPLSPMDGAVEANGGSHDDDPTDCNPENKPSLDESAGAHARRGRVEGGLAATLVAAASQGVADAARSDRALAPDAGARCAVCGRGGVV